MKIDHVNKQRSDDTHYVLATVPPLTREVFQAFKDIIGNDPRFTHFTFDLDTSSGLKVGNKKLTTDLAEPLNTALTQAEQHVANVKAHEQQKADTAESRKQARLEDVASALGVPIK